MATLALAAAGAAAGSALLPSGLTVLGTTIAGAAIGSQVGALAGSFVDQALFGTSGQSRTYEGPRLGDLHVLASSEGAPIPKVYGRARIGGQVIWATPFEEVAATETTSSGTGGKSSSGGAGSPATTTRTTYSYFANFAVALGEGEMTGIGRVWADGRELDLSSVTYRYYPGSANQSPDSLIVAREGAANTPAYRGTAYVVFERLPLGRFGNRLPQLSFEVFRAVDDLRERIRGVAIIPGSGEFVYANTQVTRDGEGGARVPENVNTRQAPTDWDAAMDQLASTLPNAKSASLIVSWFGTDLRAADCELRPGVERSQKDTRPLTWSVAGQSRADAYVVSLKDGRPAFGGTPSDETVVAALQDLRDRGVAVALTPFILMDIPDANTLADPYTGAAAQPVYPWRGRITTDPAPGVTGSPDKTPAAGFQVASFVGTAAVTDFAIVDGTVSYSGPSEWSFRRFVLHYAHLALAAGGVDTFVIGTELRGLTQIRDGAAHYPFVDALQQLAADVKAVLGTGTNVTYAADWSEYFGHQPADGTGDVYFHLDSLWSSPDIDAIGVDLYWPLSDWRRETAHIDAASARSIYDLAYLKSNIAGGEGYEWFYASETDRDAQVRTPITDGQGKPWVFRYKDLKSWWLNPHFDRPGGVESATSTAWVPQSKPFWIMETGCPAVDKGANQPNVFFDPKSSESALPFYAGARRDDLMQRRYLQALYEAFDPDNAGYINGLNPISSVTGKRMVDLDRIHVYAWDARPYPAFPADDVTWGDAPNWRFGHWLNGRFASLPLNEAVARILTDFGFGDFDAAELDGSVPGYVIDRIMAAREALQPLELAYFFDSVETGGRVVMRHRGAGDVIAALTPETLVETKPDAKLLTLVRGQETDLPASAKLRYVEAAGDYRGAVSEARKLSGHSGRVAKADLAVMLDSEDATAIAERWLHETWASRETATTILPPSQLALEPGDIVSSRVGNRDRLYRVIEIGDRGAREIEAQSVDPAIYRAGTAPDRAVYIPPQPVVGTADALFMDLPLLTGDEPDNAGYVAVSQAPWPGNVALYRSPEATGFVLSGIASVAATIGETLSVLPAGPAWRFDKKTRLRVRLSSGLLESVSRIKLLSGANAAAVQGVTGDWEVLQFETAVLIDELTYELTLLLRGQNGTEAAMSPVDVPPGAPFVLLNSAVARLDLTAGQVSLPLNWRFGPADRDIANQSFAQTTHAFAGVGRRPLSPVHVRASRDASGLALEWTRRTRRGGDNWDVDEVPLAEEIERFEVDILDGTSVVRTLQSDTTRATYLLADQTADFGAAPATVDCVVYQMSQTWGRGIGRVATV